MRPWGALGITIAVLVLIGVIKDVLGIVEPRSGYSSEWCDRHLGRVKVGTEDFTGRFTGTVDGIATYLVMTRNDDLDPPYQISRTIQCPDCKEIVLPLGGCRCQLSD